jgi:LysR family transcriptional regulator, glycine cleavage system transcriptional activator
MPTDPYPSFLSLRAFEAAARRLSFTEAARDLHVSQGAISRHVRNLEKIVGRSLFHRLHRRVELTAAGQRFATALAAGFQAIHRAVEAVRGVGVAHLRVTVEPAFAARWLVPRLGDFLTLHPNIEIQIDSAVEMRALGHDADIAIRYYSSKSRPRNRGTTLLVADGVPVLARGLVSKSGVGRDSEIRGQRLLHDDQGDAWRSWFAAAGIDGFAKARHSYLNDWPLVISAALQGQGVALVASVFVERELRTGRLARLGTTRVEFGRYCLLESKDRATAKVRGAFHRWIANELGDLRTE